MHIKSFWSLDGDRKLDNPISVQFIPHETHISCKENEFNFLF